MDRDPPPACNDAVSNLSAVNATSGPLVQRWYSRAGRPRSRDPYFLYAAGNVGGLTALLTSPFLIEPSTSRRPGEPGPGGWGRRSCLLADVGHLPGEVHRRVRGAVVPLAVADRDGCGDLRGGDAGDVRIAEGAPAVLHAGPGPGLLALLGLACHGLLAPVLFDWIAELPLVVVALALILRTGPMAGGRRLGRAGTAVLLVGPVVTLVMWGWIGTDRGSCWDSPPRWRPA